MKITVNELECVVDKVFAKGPHGPYAVATSDKPGFGREESITFSLSPDVWEEPAFPEPGNMVLLSDIRRKWKGWRAHRARFLRP